MNPFLAWCTVMVLAVGTVSVSYGVIGGTRRARPWQIGIGLVLFLTGLVILALTFDDWAR